MNEARGILDGVDAWVDDALKIGNVGMAPHYSHKESWLGLYRMEVDWPWLVSAMASQIEENWNKHRAKAPKGSPSRNWRNVPQPYRAESNRSQEKRLEKEIARLKGWVNQVPTCSGVNGSGERKRSVDLARMVGTELELIELKVKSNTPLHAAIEVLIYGLLYRFSRKNREELGYTSEDNPLVFKPERVALKVLAPAGYYPDDRDGLAALRRLEDGVAAGLAGLDTPGCRFVFSFECFDPKEAFPITPQSCRAALERRRRVGGR